MNTTLESTPQFVVTDVKMADEWDHRAALVSICIGPVTIRGVQIWRNPRSGKLRVNFPGYEVARKVYEDAIVVDADLRSEIEAAVIAAYKAAKKQTPTIQTGGRQ